MISQISTWTAIYTIEYILLGNGTSSSYWEKEFSSLKKDLSELIVEKISPKHKEILKLNKDNDRRGYYEN